jgi:hypothetical protein
MERIHRVSLLVLYQFALVVGIALLPVAMVTDRLGLRIPAHRLVRRLGNAYEQSQPA